MTSATGNEHAAVRPADRTLRRRTASAGSAGGSGLFPLLWLIFFAVLVLEPARLDVVWAWFRDLPVIGQVVGWVVLLPLMLGLLIWQAPWAPWLRVILIVLLALGTVMTFSSRSPRPQEEV